MHKRPRIRILFIGALMNETEIIKTSGLQKIYGGTVALAGADLSFRRGEVHALAGENGAGKSTFCKILSGAISPTSGVFSIDGVEYKKLTPSESKAAGISMIYQEFNMVNDVPVYENIFIGSEIRKNGIIVDKKEMIRQAQELFLKMDVDVDAKALPRDLSVAQCQLVEIAKALKDQCKVLVMDEPTAALTNKEIGTLLNLIRRLKEEGITIIYISHRMDEIMDLSDRVTIMRDGHVITTLTTAETTQKEIIALMVGRELGTTFPERTATVGDVALEVKNLCTNKIKNVSFKLHRGEILGFAGLVGSGRTEIVRAIFGADKLDSGEIYVDGKKVEIKNPAQAISLGIGMIPEDRKRQGVHLDQSIKSNMTLLRQKDISTFFTILSKKEKELANEYIRALSIKLGSIDHMVSSLSGGNQQKIVLTKWLAAQPDIIFFDEPTRGIDVGAKAEIYELMDQLRKQGKAIVLISSEMEEVLGMSNRIIVMYEGSMTGELPGSEATQNLLMSYASNITTNV